MSDVAQRARTIAGALLPRAHTAAPPGLADVDRALAELRSLRPVDAYDEMALHEAGETLLRLRDAVRLRSR